jgi:hypothetical protein
MKTTIDLPDDVLHRVKVAAEIISEDFAHGQNYGGIRATNPFR